MTADEYRSKLSELDKAKPKPPKRRFSTANGFPTALEARYQERLAAWHAEKRLLIFQALISKKTIGFDRPGHKTSKAACEFARQFKVKP